MSICYDHRVSFGNDGSLVKTLVFEAEQDHVTSAHERRFYEDMKRSLSAQHQQLLSMTSTAASFPVDRPRPSVIE